MNKTPSDGSSASAIWFDRALSDEEVRQDYELSRGCPGVPRERWPLALVAVLAAAAVLSWLHATGCF